MIVQADAVEWLLSLDAESVDLMVTDPAYESLEKHRSKGTTTRLKQSKSSSNEWFAIFRNDRMPDLFQAAYRALKQNTHAYIMCDQESMFVFKPMAEAAGFKFQKFLIWDKEAIGMGYNYRARHELILFLKKGKRRLNDLGIPDVLSCKRIRGGYPTEKPVKLLETLVAQSTVEGDLVVDPFVGSGSTGVAAINQGRRFIGCDLNPSAVERAVERLRQAESFPEVS